MSDEINSIDFSFMMIHLSKDLEDSGELFIGIKENDFI